MKKSIVIAALAALSLSSCLGDLDQYPLSDTTVSGSDIYENPLYRKGMLSKIYGSFTLVGLSGSGSADISVSDAGASEFLRAWWSIQTVSTDEAKIVWGDGWVNEVKYNAWTDTKNDAIYATYTRAMMMISSANDFLRNTNDADPEVARERAEVRFLRSYAYWILLDCFGNPPFVDETAPVGDYKPLQTDPVTLFGWIESELKALTADDSALAAAGTRIYPRVDKGAAYGLLARLYLNHRAYLGQENAAYWEGAKRAAEAVIVAYPLAGSYANLFRGDNGENPDALREIVYAACYDADKTQSYGGPTFFIAASQGDDKYLGTTEGWNGLVISHDFVKRYFGAEADKAETGRDHAFDDRRALVTLRNSSDKEMNATAFDRGWHLSKYNNNPSTGELAVLPTYASIDFPLMRSGEMYLAYAEADARLKGGATTDAVAVGYYNAIRARADRNADEDDSITLSEIFDETTRELCFEGQRRTILIRFTDNRGESYFTSADFLWPYKGGVATGQALSSHLKLFPIPSDDLQANDNLEQNDGYAK